MLTTQPKTYEAKDIIYPALIISVSFCFPFFFFLSGSKALRIIHPRSVFGCKNFCSYGRIVNVLRWLGGNNQCRACIGLLESIPDSALWESELPGCTQRATGQGYFDFSNQWGHRPFWGPICTSHMSQTSDNLNDLVVYTTTDEFGWAARGFRTVGCSGSQVVQFLEKSLKCLKQLKINLCSPYCRWCLQHLCHWLWRTRKVPSV